MAIAPISSARRSATSSHPCRRREEVAPRLQLDLGLRNFTRADSKRRGGRRELDIRVLGLASSPTTSRPISPGDDRIADRARRAAGERRGQGRARRSPGLTITKEQTMKYRVLDVMSEALGLVKKSDLGGATALSARLCPASPRREARRQLEAPPHRPSAKVIRCRPAVRWAKPCAPCGSGRSSRRARPKRPNRGPRRISAKSS